MKKLSKTFLTAQEQEQLKSCVREAEKSTAGEIVPLVVSASYHYPTSTLLGALIVSVLLAAAATVLDALLKPWGALSLLDMWVFPAAFGIFFLVVHLLLRGVPALQRLFVSAAEMTEEVEEAAITSFFRHGLAKTRDRTGILIFVSVFERRCYVLADQGINAKVAPETWKQVVDLVVAGIRAGKPADGLCRAVSRCGELLRSHFPAKPDDRDELANLIVEA